RLEHQGGVLGAFTTGDALDDDLRLAVQINRHCSCSRLSVVGLGVGQLGGLVGAFVHAGGDGHERVVRGGEDGAAFLDGVAVQTDDQRLGGGVTQDFEGLDDAFGNGNAGSNATEDVHEDAL